MKNELVCYNTLIRVTILFFYLCTIYVYILIIYCQLLGAIYIFTYTECTWFVKRFSPRSTQAIFCTLVSVRECVLYGPLFLTFSDHIGSLFCLNSILLTPLFMTVRSHWHSFQKYLHTYRFNGKHKHFFLNFNSKSLAAIRVLPMNIAWNVDF